MNLTSSALLLGCLVNLLGLNIANANYFNSLQRHLLRRRHNSNHRHRTLQVDCAGKKSNECTGGCQWFKGDCIPAESCGDILKSNDCGDAGCFWSGTEIGCVEPPTASPTTPPTLEPTQAPTTVSPTLAPITASPTSPPTDAPTDAPSKKPTSAPTGSPITPSPTKFGVTDAPTMSPSKKPTESPTKKPTVSPTITQQTSSPTKNPTEAPSPSSTPLTFVGNPPPAPLGECQGDCDDDSDCQEGLRCFKRDEFESVPGCSGDGDLGDDYCAKRETPTTLFLTGNGDVVGLCEGDCDNNLECAGTLECFSREGLEAVPGCDGLGEIDKEYCYDPNATYSPTASPSNNSGPTSTPSKSPTKNPTGSPTKEPTNSPITSPTKKPTGSPTNEPTGSPSTKPSESPTTLTPTSSPTDSPTKKPTHSPVTPSPTAHPIPGVTNPPTSSPTKKPTGSPTTSPTKYPTTSPTDKPSVSDWPTSQPSESPSISLSPSTTHPTSSPTKEPTGSPTEKPTNSPTKVPTSSPTNEPTVSPTKKPTNPVTSSPTMKPTPGPVTLVRQQLQSISTNTNTATKDKPQSKVWKHEGTWWGVFRDTSDTHLWRLDGIQWTKILMLSTQTDFLADCKPYGDVTHILLYNGSSSQLASVEYVPGDNTYKLWSVRESLVSISLSDGGEIGTIDIDSTGRMWLASDSSSQVQVRYSDSPYDSWSSALVLATGINSDDISAVVAMNGMVGVFWTNQATERFGFRTHNDVDLDPDAWSADEVPASQSALNRGNGMADDHVNLAVGSDNTLYAAVKTEYDTSGFPTIALLVRRPDGNWDDLYEVDGSGTRPIVVLDETLGTLKVIYTKTTGFDDIVFKESPLQNINLGSRQTLITGNRNHVSSTKQILQQELLVVASSSSAVVSVLEAPESLFSRRDM